MTPGDEPGVLLPIRDLRHAKGVILHTTRARPLRRTMREANRLRHSRWHAADAKSLGCFIPSSWYPPKKIELRPLTEEERATLEKLIKSQTALQDS